MTVPTSLQGIYNMARQTIQAMTPLPNKQQLLSGFAAGDTSKEDVLKLLNIEIKIISRINEILASLKQHEEELYSAIEGKGELEDRIHTIFLEATSLFNKYKEITSIVQKEKTGIEQHHKPSVVKEWFDEEELEKLKFLDSFLNQFNKEMRDLVKYDQELENYRDLWFEYSNFDLRSFVGKTIVMVCYICVLSGTDVRAPV